MNQNRKRAVIFDLDGTLWDSSEQVVESWNIALAKHRDLNRQITNEEMRGYMGKQMEVIARLMLPNITEKYRLEVLHECCEEEQNFLAKRGAVLYPKLIETLEKLKEKYDIYIVSNCQDGYIQVFLDYYKLWNTFDDIEMAGRTGKCKSENISIIMKRNNVDEAVYVGDTNGDMEAADMAGIPFIHAAYGFGRPDRECPSVKSFDKIPDVVAQILE